MVERRLTTMSLRPIHVAVVAFGSPDILRNCLAGLADSYPCLVVDNDSSAEVQELCRGLGVRYLDSGTNLGFAAGANRAFAELPLPQCDVLLLNPDAVVEPSVVRRLSEVLHSGSDVACVAPAQRGPESARLDAIHCPFPTPLGACLDAIGLGRLRRPRFLVGSVLLINGAALVDLGGFDEQFFLYGEETDWQLRAVHRDWKIAYCPEVVALHIKGGTDPDSRRRDLRSSAGAERYIRKWYRSSGWQLYRFASAFGLLMRIPILRGERRHTAAVRARLLLRGPDRAARLAGVLEPAKHHIPTLPE